MSPHHHAQAGSARPPDRQDPMSRPAWAVVLLLVLGLSAAQVHRQASLWAGRLETVSGGPSSPLLAQPDSYFFVRLAQDLAEDRYRQPDEKRWTLRPAPPPLLSALLAAIHRWTGVSVELAAFYLPPILSLVLSLAVLLWGRAAGSSLTGLGAMAAMAASPLWVLHTSVAALDTDPLNPALLLLVGWCAHGFAFSARWRRWAFLGLGLLLWGLFYFWWKFGAVLCLVFVPLSALTFRDSPPGLERRAKLCLLGLTGLLAAAALALLAAGPIPGLPGDIAEPLGFVQRHLDLFLEQGAGAFFQKETIDELTGLTFQEWTVGVSGAWPVFLAALAGLTFFLVRAPRAALFLLPALALGLLSWRYARFVIFLAPLAALGLGVFPALVAEGGLSGRIPRGWPRSLAALALAAVLLAPGLFLTFTHPMNHAAIRPAHDHLALALRQHTPAEAVVWSWWELGYFFQHAGERKTFFDGGSQSPEEVFIASYALSCPDLHLARNWLRYFSAYGLEGLMSFSRALGDPEKAVRFLAMALSGERPPEEAAALFGLPPEKGLGARLFPEARAAVCLPHDFLRYSYWYAPVAHLFNDKAAILRLPAMQTELDAARRAILFQGRAFPFQFLAQSGPGLLSIPPQASGRLVLVPENPDMIWLVDDPLYKTLAFRLLSPVPMAHPGFATVFFRPDVGGVWNVE